MSRAELQCQSAGFYSLVGELSFDTVPTLMAAGEQLFQSGGEVTLDLSRLERSDSAGLALLMSWLRQARKNQSRLKFQQIPEQLLRLARVSAVDQLLLSE
jgi:phospholipid transport system transporter-binding protein